MYELQQGEMPSELKNKITKIEMGEKKNLFWVEIRSLTETNWEADEISADLKKNNGIEVKF